MNCGVGHRCGLDPTLLWLWYRTAAITPIPPLDWELPYATGVALKKKKREKNIKSDFLTKNKICLTGLKMRTIPAVRN